METINATAREQFVTDYCLVVDNEKEKFEDILGRENTRAGSVSGLSDELREEFETYISQVAERESEAGRKIGALLISQMLIGFGSAVFDDIARHYITLTKESQQ
jgi:hypothetical protein